MSAESSSGTEGQDFVWAQLPFQVDVPADPSGAQQGKFTFKLNEDLLEELFRLESPIYHAYPRRFDSKEDGRPFGLRPSYTAIAGVSSIAKDLNKTLFDPFRDALRRRQGFDTEAVSVSWEAPTLPHVAVPRWWSADTLCHHLRNTLFATVGAILRLLPTEYQMYVAEEEKAKSSTVRIVAMLPPTAGSKRKNGGRTPQVAMLVDVVPWLLEPDIEALVKSAGEFTVEDLLHFPRSERERLECHWVALHRLALRMRAHNAAVGVLYNGCEAIVVERDFEHDMLRLRHLARETGPPSARTRSQEVTPALTTDESSPTMDLQLRIWKTGFSHPADTDPPDVPFKPRNPATTIAALAWYALGRLHDRPKPLNDASRESAIHEYLLKVGKCPCLSPNSDPKPNAKILQQAVEDSCRRLDPLAPATFYAYPDNVTDFLQRVRLNDQALNDRPIDDGENGPSPQKYGDERTKWIIAMGTVSCSSGPPRTYLLTSVEWDREWSSDRLAEVWGASLHIVTEADAATTAQAALGAAMYVVSDGGDADGSPDRQADRAPRSDHLYVTSSQVVEKVRASLRSTCGQDNVFRQEVSLKLPALAPEHWTSWDNRPSGWLKGPSQPDPLLCKCPRGLCDSICPNCIDHFHDHERVTLQRHVHTTLLASKVEHAALSVLRDEQSLSTLNGISSTPLVSLNLTFRGSQVQILATWPLLAPLAELKWPVDLHVGVRLSDVFDYAHLCLTEAGDLADIFEYDEHWGCIETDTCDKVFSYLANKPEYLRALVDDVEQTFRRLFAEGFGPDHTTTWDIFIGFLDPQAITLFGCQAGHSPEDVANAAARPHARLINSATHGFQGDLASLDLPRSKSVKEKPVKRATMGPLKAFWTRRVYFSRYLDFIIEDLGNALLGFRNYWCTNAGDCTAPSAAPAMGPRAGPERA